MNKELVVSPGYKGGLGGRAWSPGLRVGPWLFLSGITSVDYQAGKTVGRGESPAPFTPGKVDPEAQWRQVLTNIKEIVEGAGGTMADIVRDALRRQLALEAFEQLRREVLPFAEARGYLTDEDVFRDVS